MEGGVLLVPGLFWDHLLSLFFLVLVRVSSGPEDTCGSIFYSGGGFWRTLGEPKSNRCLSCRTSMNLQYACDSLRGRRVENPSFPQIFVLPQIYLSFQNYLTRLLFSGT